MMKKASKERIILIKDFDDFIENKFKPQLKWYGKKAQHSKTGYYFLQLPILVIAPITPILALLGEAVLYLTVFLSALLAIFIGLQHFFRFKEHWVLYRNTKEVLEQEYDFFATKSIRYSPVKCKEPQELFLKRYHKIRDLEREQWLDLSLKKEEGL